MVWWGVMWCGVVWCGVVWCGGVVVWCGVVWCGVVLLVERFFYLLCVASVLLCVSSVGQLKIFVIACLTSY